MSTDAKSVVTRYYQLVQQPDELDEVCSLDLKGHGQTGADLKGLKTEIRMFLEAFPDLRTDIRHLVQEGDLISSWVTYRGTHQGVFAGIPGSGRPVNIAGWDLVRVEDGKIVEITSFCDLFALMNQIGALPTAAPA